jgi:diguanylate cyclase (GGDEF)-like protein/PAS domain S-box-containing protein
LFENSPVAYLALDEKGSLVDVNMPLRELLGYCAGDLVGKYFVDLCEPQARPEFAERCSLFQRTGTVQCDVRLARKDGTRVDVSLHGRVQHDAQGQFVKAHCILYDITERKRAEDELQRAKGSLEIANRDLELALKREHHLARTDPLTRLSNRLAFFELAEYEYKGAARYQRPLSVIMMDVDHFKQVNDAYGHVTGDKLLAHLAETIRLQLRRADTLARYGGEEFIALLPATGAAQASIVAQRILTSARSLVLPLENASLQVTMSLGVASFNPRLSGEDSVDAIVGRADQAMYAAKAAGRNRVTVLHGSQHQPDEPCPGEE